MLIPIFHAPNVRVRFKVGDPHVARYSKDPSILIMWK